MWTRIRVDSVFPAPYGHPPWEHPCWAWSQSEASELHGLNATRQCQPGAHSLAGTSLPLSKCEDVDIYITEAESQSGRSRRKGLSWLEVVLGLLTH